ncbi:MAG: hypothetical protein P8R39_07555 [Alphaproteobacteria bacterium]|nr:hypothetical protein [Alphaproteobacteria bacterium]
MLLRTFLIAGLAGATLGIAGCGSLSGTTRDAFAPFFELSQPETVNDVIVGGTNPYATSVQHSLANPAPMVQPQVIGVFANSQAEAQQMIYQAITAQCGASAQMSPAQFANGQWISTVQCPR